MEIMYDAYITFFFVSGMMKQTHLFLFIKKTALINAIYIKVNIVAILSVKDVCFKIILI